MYVDIGQHALYGTIGYYVGDGSMTVVYWMELSIKKAIPPLIPPLSSSCRPRLMLGVLR